MSKVFKTEFGKKEYFSKNDTLFFKGIAILLIVLHNYFHIIQGFGIENEFLFHDGNYLRFYNTFISFDIKNQLAGIFSFLGHYGVQIFFFFSAYGLTIQYSNWKESDFKFIFRRLKKIYFLLLFAVLFCVVFFEIIGISFGFKGTVARTLILGSTLNSFTTLSMFSGPFWFFAAIIQFYIIFPFLYKFVLKFRLDLKFVPLILSLCLVYIFYFYLDGLTLTFGEKTFDLSVFRNVIGHLPELILGIIMAVYGKKSFSFLFIIGALLIYIFSQIYSFIFPLSFVSMTVLLLPLISFIERKMNNFFKQIILFTGNISMILFIVNGPFRSLSLFDVSPDLKLERIFLYLILLYTLSYLLFRVYEFLRLKLKI